MVKYFKPEIKKAAIEEAARLSAIDQKIEDLKVNQMYASVYKTEQLAILEKERTAVFDSAMKRVNDILSKFIKTTEAKYLPKGEEITPDAKIFESGISLTEAEVRQYAEKYAAEKNHTMIRIIAKYAEAKDMIWFSEIYHSKEKVIAAAGRLATACKSAISDRMYLDMVITNGDNFEKMAGPELTDATFEE